MNIHTTRLHRHHPEDAAQAGWPARALGALVLAALGASAVHAQDQEEPAEADPPVPQEQEPQEQEQEQQPVVDDTPDILNPLGGSGQDDPIQQLIDLFHTVERNLEAVDQQLMQAGTGVLPLEAPADAGLDDLLQDALSKSRQVTEEIDRMLDLAQQVNSMQQQQSQSSQQGQQGQQSQGQPGESPLDERQSGGEQGREQTPEGPREDGGRAPGEDQQGQGEQDQGEQDQQERDGQDGDPNQDPNDTNPDGDEDNPESGQNRPGEEQGGERGPGTRPSDDAERWGELPVRVREVFRNQGREDLPVQYRDWIDAYYRRLNRGDG